MSNLKIGSEYVLDKDGFIQSYPIGSIVMSSSSVVPTGWLVCDGSEYNQSDYPELFNRIGHEYGVPAGLPAAASGKFRVPPLCVGPSNPDPRIPSSKITSASEGSYSVSSSHSHSVNANANFDGSNHYHNHNNNTGALPGVNLNHSHGGVGGSNGNTNADGTFSSGRATGPAGPYASTPANHVHGPGGFSGNSDGANTNHTHYLTVHNVTNYTHYHSVGTPSTTVSSSSNYPLSRQVFFLIKH